MVLPSYSLIEKSKAYALKQDGSALIMVIPVMIVLAVFMVGIMQRGQSKDFHRQVANVIEMENVVEVALASFANKNNRLPCPADPSATGNTIGLEISGCATAGEVPEGILPWKALNLPRSAAFDEYGNPYTYKVSPSFAREITMADFNRLEDPLLYQGAAPDEDNALPIPDPQNLTTYVHEYCRTPRWNQRVSYYKAPDGNSYEFVESTPDDTGAGLTGSFIDGVYNMNTNLMKAQFCCAPVFAGTAPTIETIEFDHNDYRVPLEAKIRTELAVKGRDREGNQTIDNVFRFSGAANCEAAVDGHGVYHNRPTNSNHANCQSKPVDFVWFEDEDDDGHIIASGMGMNTGAYSGGNPPINFEDFRIRFLDKASIPYEFYIEIVDLGANDLNKDIAYSLVFEDIFDRELVTVTRKFTTPSAAPNGIARFTFQKSDYATELQAVLDNNSLSIDQVRFKELVLHTYYIPAFDFLELNDLDSTSLAISKVGYSYEVGGVGMTGMEDLVPLNAAQERILAERTPQGYDPADVNAMDEIAPNVEAVAFALISHGPDGQGAYLLNGTDGKHNDGNQHPLEAINSGGGLEFVDSRTISTGDDVDYDDDVIWSSQIALYNKLGDATCEQSQALRTVAYTSPNHNPDDDDDYGQERFELLISGSSGSNSNSSGTGTQSPPPKIQH